MPDMAGTVAEWRGIDFRHIRPGGGCNGVDAVHRPVLPYLPTGV